MADPLSDYTATDATQTTASGVAPGYPVPDAEQFEVTGTDPAFTSPSGKEILGRRHTHMRLALRKTAGDTVDTDWLLRLSYATGDHGLSTSYCKELSTPSPVPALNEWAVYEFDMTDLTAGGDDWVDSTITQWEVALPQDPTGVWQALWLQPGTLGRSLGRASYADVGAIGGGTVGPVSGGVAAPVCEIVDVQVTADDLVQLFFTGRAITSGALGATYNLIRMERWDSGLLAYVTIEGGLERYLAPSGSELPITMMGTHRPDADGLEHYRVTLYAVGGAGNGNVSINNGLLKRFILTKGR